MSREGALNQDDANSFVEVQAGQPGARKISTLFIVILILTITFLTYARTTSYAFVYDDRAQIIENPLIKSWDYAPRYLASHVWTQEYPGAVGNYYRPVFLFWLLINYMMFGLNASWWHFSTIAVHVCVTLLVYMLARRLIEDQWSACMTALIFGLHPVHIEAVAWVSGVTEPLLALFLIPAFLFYMNWRSQPASKIGAPGISPDVKIEPAPLAAGRNRVWLASSLALYAVALLEKETALVLPALIFVYEWVFGSRESLAGPVDRVIKITKRATPYIVLSILYLVSRAIVLKGLGHTITNLPLLTIVLTWPSLLWTYMKMLVWPLGLSAFYDTSYVSAPGLVNFALPLLAVLTAAAGLIVWSRKVRIVGFASALIIVPILPVLNLSVFFPGEIAHDRYLYLPSIGFSILVALALKRISHRQAKLFGQPMFQALATIILAGLLGLATALQSVNWTNNLSLYNRGVSAAPDNPIAKNNLANEMLDRQMYDEAIGLYQQVLDHDPSYWRASYNLGLVYYKTGMYADAEPYFERSLELNQVDSDQFTYLGLTRMKLGRLDEAVVSLRHAITMRPAAVGYHYALGIVLKLKGEFEAAISEFEAEFANNHNQEAARAQIAELESMLKSKK